MSVCFQNLPPYGDNLCQTDKSAAISAFGIVKRGQTDITDFSNPTEWNTAIANGNAVVAKYMSIDLPDGSPVNITSKRQCISASEVQVGVDYTATVIDPNVSVENETFYTSINGKNHTLVLFYCGEDEIRVLHDVSVSARMPQAVGGRTDTQHYNVTFSWQYENDDFGELLDAPAGIFTE